MPQSVKHDLQRAMEALKHEGRVHRVMPHAMLVTPAMAEDIRQTLHDQTGVWIEDLFNQRKPS